MMASTPALAVPKAINFDHNLSQVERIITSTASLFKSLAIVPELSVMVCALIARATLLVLVIL